MLVPRVPGLVDLVQVARGGSSVVWRAREVALDRWVAVKVLDTPLHGEDGRRRFERELAVAGRLSAHPHVVTVYGSTVTDEGRACITSEWCPGGSLLDVLQARGPLDAAQAAAAGAAVAEALAAAHAGGTAHRDVKPGNVLVRSYGTVGLADFGIAAATGVDATSATSSLTPAHAAPEVLMGEQGGTAADVWGLGSTLWTVLTGSPPFAARADEGPLPLMLRIRNDDLPPLGRHVPAGLEDLLRALLSKDPGQRPSAAQAAAALRPFAQGAAPLPAAPLPGGAATPSGDGAREHAPAHDEQQQTVLGDLVRDRAPAPAPEPAPARRPLLLAAALAAVLLLVAGGVTVSRLGGPGGDGAAVAATVGDSRVETADLDAEAARYRAVAGPEAAGRALLLTRRIQHLLLEELARREGMPLDAAAQADRVARHVASVGGAERVRHEYAQIGAGPDDLDRQLAWSSLYVDVQAELTEDLPVSQALLQRTYAEDQDRYDTVRATDVLVADLPTAQAVAAELAVDPSRWDAVARERSLDDLTRDRGGDLGYVGRGDVSPEVADALFGASVGDRLIASDEDGVHVLRVVDRQTTSFTEALLDLRGTVLREQQDARLAEALGRVAQDLGVEVAAAEGRWDASGLTVVART